MGWKAKCQCSHAEAIFTLYTSNRFAFPEPLHLCVFKKAILPQRWSSIRRVRINMSFQEAAHTENGGAPSARWNEIATALKQVDSLLEFTIHMASFPNELVQAVQQVSDTTSRQLTALLDNFSLLSGMMVVRSPWQMYVTCGEWFDWTYPEETALSRPPQEICSSLQNKLQDRGVDCTVDGFDPVHKGNSGDGIRYPQGPG